MGASTLTLVPDRANFCWSLDLMYDALTDGQRFRVLAVMDGHTRECLALVAGTSLAGIRVVREQDAVIEKRGRPSAIISDSSTAFTPMAILRWCQQTGAEWHHASPESQYKGAVPRRSTAVSTMRA